MYMCVSVCMCVCVCFCAHARARRDLRQDHVRKYLWGPPYDPSEWTELYTLKSVKTCELLIKLLG